VKLLLDTHSFIWFIEDNPSLSSHARVLIEDSANEVFLSMASV
jgi:PIN domain nuclease of toxin-antitoxin system